MLAHELSNEGSIIHAVPLRRTRTDGRAAHIGSLKPGNSLARCMLVDAPCMALLRLQLVIAIRVHVRVMLEARHATASARVIGWGGGGIFVDCPT